MNLGYELVCRMPSWLSGPLLKGLWKVVLRYYKSKWHSGRGGGCSI